MADCVRKRNFRDTPLAGCLGMLAVPASIFLGGAGVMYGSQGLARYLDRREGVESYSNTERFIHEGWWDGGECEDPVYSGNHPLVYEGGSLVGGAMMCFGGFVTALGVFTMAEDLGSREPSIF